MGQFSFEFHSVNLILAVTMGKMRKGKNHHWYKASLDRTKKKSTYVPSGKPRGRPKATEEEIIEEPKAKMSKTSTPTGRRGRPKSSDGSKTEKYVPTGKPRGRPSKNAKKEEWVDEDDE